MFLKSKRKLLFTFGLLTSISDILHVTLQNLNLIWHVPQLTLRIHKFPYPSYKAVLLHYGLMEDPNTNQVNQVEEVKEEPRPRGQDRQQLALQLISEHSKVSSGDLRMT